MGWILPIVVCEAMAVFQVEVALLLAGVIIICETPIVLLLEITLLLLTG